MKDISIIIWKEWKDLLFQGGITGYIRPLIMIGVLGVLLPLQSKTSWLDLPLVGVLGLLLVPFLVIITMVGDSFAGERERHTLETLLASRMPDRAILLGKIGAILGYAWSIMLISLLVGLVTTNLAFWKGHLVFYPLDMTLAVIALSLVVNALGACGGVLVSLRAATVRQAQQILTIGMMVLSFGGAFLVSFILRTLPPTMLPSLSIVELLFIIVAIVAIVDLILLGLAFVRFQRSRLITA
jgi:ABC-2 type transport system permease protein